MDITHLPLINSPSLRQKRNNRLLYYLKSCSKYYYPRNFLKLDFEKYQTALEEYGEEAAHERLNYYIKLRKPFNVGKTAVALENMTLKNNPSLYLLDFMEYGRFFPQKILADYIFLDVIHVPDTPTIVKSRPVSNNDNSVLMKLDKVRHFLFVRDNLKFREKENRLVWRGSVYQPHRERFMKEFFQKSPLLDVGQYNKKSAKNPQWQMPFMNIENQLRYKFILSIEGNDVATSTKWSMSSNSLVLMTRPKYETWYMEGRMIPNYHYVLVKDDYSDLESLVEYYIDNPGEAEEIIKNAQDYVKKFQSPKIEDWLNLKVLEKYFTLSGQLG